jgi:hypothetical protein
VRDHDVTTLTAAELAGARRELVRQLGSGPARLTRPRADPSRISAIDAELAVRGNPATPAREHPRD